MSSIINRAAFEEWIKIEQEINERMKERLKSLGFPENAFRGWLEGLTDTALEGRTIRKRRIVSTK